MMNFAYLQIYANSLLAKKWNKALQANEKLVFS